MCVVGRDGVADGDIARVEEDEPLFTVHSADVNKAPQSELVLARHLDLATVTTRRATARGDGAIETRLLV